MPQFAVGKRANDNDTSASAAETSSIGNLLGALLGGMALLLLTVFVVLQRERVVILRCKQRVCRFVVLKASPNAIEDSRHEIPLATIVSDSRTFIQDDDYLRHYIQEKITWYPHTCQCLHAQSLNSTHCSILYLRATHLIALRCTSHCTHCTSQKPCTVHMHILHARMQVQRHTLALIVHILHIRVITNIPYTCHHAHAPQHACMHAHGSKPTLFAS